MNTLEEFIKLCINALVNCSGVVNNHVESSDFLKFLNKALTCLIFYLIEIEKLNQNVTNYKKPLTTELEKIIKFLFKLCFVGNETFHEKIFGRKKENDYESFSFDTAYLKGGISSYSECSDMEDIEKSRDLSKN